MFSKSWEKTKEYFWFLVISVVVLSLITGIFADVKVVGYMVRIFALLAFSSVVLAIIHDKKPRFNDLTKHFAHYRKPLKMLIISIIVYLATLVGLFLFILPGIYLGIRFMFYPYYVLEHEHKTVFQSIKEIFAITKGNFWNLFLLAIGIIAINFLGVLALGVGIFVTLPITAIATGYAYKTLTPHVRR